MSVWVARARGEPHTSPRQSKTARCLSGWQSPEGSRIRRPGSQGPPGVCLGGSHQRGAAYVAQAVQDRPVSVWVAVTRGEQHTSPRQSKTARCLSGWQSPEGSRIRRPGSQGPPGVCLGGSHQRGAAYVAQAVKDRPVSVWVAVTRGEPHTSPRQSRTARCLSRWQSPEGSRIRRPGSPGPPGVCLCRWPSPEGSRIRTLATS